MMSYVFSSVFVLVDKTFVVINSSLSENSSDFFSNSITFTEISFFYSTATSNAEVTGPLYLQDLSIVDKIINMQLLLL